eukprot:2064899-Rhodomonas_salina.1
MQSGAAHAEQPHFRYCPPATLLRTPIAMSGTEILVLHTTPFAVFSTEILVVRTPYAMSGTEIRRRPCQA